MKTTTRKRSGQAMVEYIIIVVVIAIAAIAVFQLFGRGVREKAAGATASISNTYGSEAAGAVEGNDDIKDLTAEGR